MNINFEELPKYDVYNMHLTDDDYKLAEQNGISRQTAYHRFYSLGWSAEKTVNTPLNKSSKDRSLWRKKCDEIGLKYSTFQKRVRKGMKPEDAFYLPRKPKLSLKQIEIASSNGIGMNTVMNRVYNQKWDVERAITEPVDKRKTRISNRGIEDEFTTTL
ncbi:hypothetical protein F7731_08530 [Cytobacillus depressus]|uniref:Uncharacterized protein n=1 Tax=Cytobacillus depressus TaxID=1602942 RepID=A0A6L3VEN6_9BACI|nr:hypothetical protein [Cytobacillus depressus]KAB2337631.1 hypothetical protein F7731_08530 [Cytobacillus depressus]